MKRPTREDITPSLYGDETLNDNRYASKLEKYIEYLEQKANDSEVIHSVMPCYELEGEAEEFWQETPDLITLEINGVKIWTDNDSEYKLKEGEKYSVKIYKA